MDVRRGGGGGGGGRGGGSDCIVFDAFKPQNLPTIQQDFVPSLIHHAQMNHEGGALLSWLQREDHKSAVGQSVISQTWETLFGCV